MDEINDHVLFKFRRIDNFLYKSIINSQLYFSTPDNLNDPFDCRVDVIKSLRNAIARADCILPKALSVLLKMEDNFNDLSHKLKSFGVSSFSLRQLNPLLWSHYADQHRGVCLMYQFPPDFIAQVPEIVGIAEVVYGKNPLTTWFRLNAHQLIAEDIKSIDNGQTDSDKFIQELVKVILTIKDRCWRYENEVRIIRALSGDIDISRNFLKQVCFGLHTSPTDKMTIIKLINSCGYNVEFCEITRTNNDFGIDAIELCQ